MILFVWLSVCPFLLGDLFDMLLPMLSIYQEYVRNHHYSLQVLTECKSRPEFSIVLRRLEAKPLCKGRSLEMFLTYPMHQVSAITFMADIQHSLTQSKRTKQSFNVQLIIISGSTIYNHIARTPSTHAIRPC